MIVYTARHVVPIASPPITAGAVAVVDGRVVAVGRAKDVVAKAGAEAARHDLGDAVLLPGLVNTHTHLDHAWMRAAPPPCTDWMTWVTEIEERQRGASEDEVLGGAEAAVREMIARGTAAVGDAASGSGSLGALLRSNLHAIVFLELHALRSDEAERELDAAAERLDRLETSPEVRAAGGRVRMFLTPHSALTASAALLKALAGRAIASAEPLSIHVAESDVENSFLHDGRGPWSSRLQQAGVDSEVFKSPGQSPIEWLDRLGVLSARTLAIHASILGQQDLSRLQARRVTVVACPRSDLRLGSGKTPVPKLLMSGIPVALGTESPACVPDPDLFAEMAALRTDHPSLAPAAVIRMATVNGARALGLDGIFGTLEPGKTARLVAVPLEDPADDPLEVITSGPSQVIPLPEPGSPSTSETN